MLKYYPETYAHEKADENMRKLRKIALRWWDAERLGRASQFRWIETRALPDALETLVTSGRVPGHVSVIAHTSDGPVVVAGDALLNRDDKAAVLTMIPHSREQFHHDRARILSISGRILPGHDAEFSNAAIAAQSAFPGASP